MSKKTITYFSIIAIVIGSIFLANGLILAWTAPSSSPPGGNVPAPLNVGSTGQSKAGGLILNTGGAANGLVVDKGNVGIGTGAPGEKLDVNGYVKGRTGLCIGNDCRNSWPGADIHDQSNCYWKAVAYGWDVDNTTLCNIGYYMAGVQARYNALAWDHHVSYIYCCAF